MTEAKSPRDADLRLKALFAADAPPARDPDFTFSLLKRLERRRLIAESLLNAGLATAAGGLLWAFWPQVDAWTTALAPELAPAAIAISVALAGLTSLAIFDRSFGPAA